MSFTNLQSITIIYKLIYTIYKHTILIHILKCRAIEACLCQLSLMKLHTHTHTCTHTNTHTHKHTHTQTHTHKHTHTYIYIYMCVCVYICNQVCMYNKLECSSLPSDSCLVQYLWVRPWPTWKDTPHLWLARKARATCHWHSSLTLKKYKL